MITFTPQQLSRLNQAYNQAAKERFVQQTHALWQENFARLMPHTPALPEPAIQKHLETSYESCLRHGELDELIVIEFAFSILRAAHLGYARTYIEEIARYFLSRPSNPTDALERISYVLGGQFKQHFTPEAAA